MCVMHAGVPQFHNLTEVAENAARICRATHADPRCVASSVMLTVLIALILQVLFIIDVRSNNIGQLSFKESDTSSCTTASEKIHVLKTGSITQLY